jgi:ATP-binding cassette subfamily F protein 3
MAKHQLAEQQAQKNKPAAVADTPAKKPAPQPAPVVIPEPQANTGQPINKEHKKELQKQQRIFKQLEEQIEQLQAEKNRLEKEMGDPGTYADKNKFLQTETAYNNIAAQLQTLNKEYEQTFEKIVELEG